MQSWKQPGIKVLRYSKHKTGELCAPAAVMKKQSQYTKRALAARSGKQSRRAAQETLAVQVREAERPNPRLFPPQPAPAPRNSEGWHCACSANPLTANFGIKAVAQAPPRGQALSVPARRCLTPHSSRGPTAKHRARATVQFIICSAGPAFYRRSRLSSNVRRHTPALRMRGVRDEPRRITPAHMTQDSYPVCTLPTENPPSPTVTPHLHPQTDELNAS
jgi:hypothetical protein